MAFVSINDDKPQFNPGEIVHDPCDYFIVHEVIKECEHGDFIYKVINLKDGQLYERLEDNLFYLSGSITVSN